MPEEPAGRRVLRGPWVPGLSAPPGRRRWWRGCCPTGCPSACTSTSRWAPGGRRRGVEGGRGCCSPRLPCGTSRGAWSPRLTTALLQDSAGEPLYKLFKAIKHQVEKGPVDAVQKKAKYTLNDTGLLGDDVEYAPLVSPGPPIPGPERGAAPSLCWGDPPGAMAQACCRPVWGPGTPRVSGGELCALPGPCELGGVREPSVLCSVLLGQAAGEARPPARVRWGLPPVHRPFIPSLSPLPADGERDRPGRRGGRHPRQGAQLRHHLPSQGEDHRPGVPHAAVLPLAQGGQCGPG